MAQGHPQIEVVKTLGSGNVISDLDTNVLHLGIGREIEQKRVKNRTKTGVHMTELRITYW